MTTSNSQRWGPAFPDNCLLFPRWLPAVPFFTQRGAVMRDTTLCINSGAFVFSLSIIYWIPTMPLSLFLGFNILYVTHSYFLSIARVQRNMFPLQNIPNIYFHRVVCINTETFILLFSLFSFHIRYIHRRVVIHFLLYLTLQCLMQFLTGQRAARWLSSLHFTFAALGSSVSVLVRMPFGCSLHVHPALLWISSSYSSSFSHSKDLLVG